jgi:hypothetical protein
MYWNATATASTPTIESKPPRIAIESQSSDVVAV